MKYTHKVRDFVKEYASVEEVCRFEGVQFNSYKRATCPICYRKDKLTKKDEINNFQCWGCGAKGDGIALYSQIHGTDFKTTILELAEKLGYQDDAEVQVAKVLDKEIKKIDIKVEERKGLTEEQIELYHNVYEALAYACNITESDYVYLNRRGIKDNKMKDFFSLRFVDEIKLGRLIQACKNSHGYTIQDIAKVPGFYLSGNKLKIANMFGIALKARNAQGKVVGIQIRTGYEECKYIWLSSEKYGGNGAGTPVSVDYPTNAVHAEKMEIAELIENSASTVFVGEGKFKGCAINKEFNSIAISLAGVNNWRGKVKQELDYIDNIRPVKNIMISFDADMCYNFQIAEQFIKMMEEELKDYSNRNVRVALWDIRYGKGIDDIIDNGFRKKLKSMPFNEFVERYNAFKAHSDKLNLTKDNKNERTMLFNQQFNF